MRISESLSASQLCKQMLITEVFNGSYIDRAKGEIGELVSQQFSPKES